MNEVRKNETKKKYAFKVKLIGISGSSVYILSAKTQKDAERIAKAGVVRSNKGTGVKITQCIVTPFLY